MSFSYDFSVLPDQNPYVNAAIDNIDGGRQILGGTFRATTTDSTWQRFRYNGPVNGDTLRVSITSGGNGNYNPIGIGFLAADGSGYMVGLNGGAWAYINTIESDKTTESVSSGQEELPDSLSAGSTLTYEITRSTGAHRVFCNLGDGEVEITDLASTDAVHMEEDLAPAILMRTDGSGQIIAGWSADIGPSGGGATISDPTPSGTIGTTTSATVGCTTDTEEGDLYVVLSETDNVSTATDEQIAAGQNSSSTAADFADDAEVEDDSPSVSFTTVLDPDTTYYYAMVQETEDGFSNVLSGSFTTAAAAVVATKLLFSAQPGNTVVGQTMSAVQVQAVNASDVLDESFDGDVTIALQTGDGTLLGTLTQAAVAGLATFDNLSIRTLNEDAVLRATADGLTQVDSNTFDIIAGAGDGTAGFPASSRLGGLLQ